MKDKREPKRTTGRKLTETEFLANPQKAVRSARTHGPVMIEANRGKARVFIIGQTEPLELG